MSKLLFSEQPLVIDKELASCIGLNNAIVIQQINYWLEINKKANKNFYDGYYWTYNSIVEWHKQFPFWSSKTVTRILNDLRDRGILIADNFNKLKIDRTLWYRIDFERLEELYWNWKMDNLKDESVEISHLDKMTKCIIPKSLNAKGQNDQMQEDKMTKPKGQYGQSQLDNLTTPLPKINTYISPENISNQSYQSLLDVVAYTQIDGLELEKTKYIQFKKIISVNIEYDILRQSDPDLLDELLDLIVMTIISDRKYIRIAGEEIPSEIVRNRFLKLNSFHIQYVIESMKKTTSDIKNIRNYLLTVLFNAPSTMNSYYSSMVNHDLAAD